jgi:calcineurin-like phosphoesterase family protein
MIFLTSDEHYGHFNKNGNGIIKYCNRPFSSIEEMNNDIIKKHNQVVGLRDTVIHCGDFTLNGSQYAKDIIEQLNGRHLFITGSHDKKWMSNINSYNLKQIELVGYIHEFKYKEYYIVACHYNMRTWPRSHYNSLLAFGHSHGNLLPLKNQLDVGVDSWEFYPVSIEHFIEKINFNQGITNGETSPSS